MVSLGHAPSPFPLTICRDSVRVTEIRGRFFSMRFLP